MENAKAVKIIENVLSSTIYNITVPVQDIQVDPVAQGNYILTVETRTTKYSVTLSYASFVINGRHM